MDGKPVVTVRVGEPISLAEIARRIEGLGEEDLKSVLQRKIREHYNLFGVEPYSIIYSRQQDDYELRANAVVGRILCGGFVLEVASKFKEIEIGKWLQLAHYSGASHLVRHDNTVAETRVSDQDQLEGIDYFVLALVSATQDCVNQGLIYERAVEGRRDSGFRGRLDIGRHVQTGANPFRVHTIQNAKNFNTAPNAIIKRALEVCVARASNSVLKGLADEMIPYFGTVDAERVETRDLGLESLSSLPRPDYEKAIALSKVILEGFAAIEGDMESFMPYYTIDLDDLFEKFVSFELARMLKKDVYDVRLQGKLPHPLVPDLPGNFIAPDILVFRKPVVGGRPVVLDAKNKYSLLSRSGAVKIANQDLFQAVYYSQAVGAEMAILVYPGDAGNFTKYPLMSSEGRAKYQEKRTRAIKAFQTDKTGLFKYRTQNSEMYIVAWRVNLSGTLRDTKESMAQLSQFVADYAKKEIL